MQLIEALRYSQNSVMAFVGAGGKTTALFKAARELSAIPEPEMTNEKKFKCPLDQQVYDNREDYNSHCKEEHDVL